MNFPRELHAVARRVAVRYGGPFGEAEPAFDAFGRLVSRFRRPSPPVGALETVEVALTSQDCETRAEESAVRSARPAR